MLYVGLLVFAAGSFLGCAADDIWTVIAARTLQGAGAISSVAMALAADLTREQHRTKVMAMIGSMIGFMFALSLVGAPLLYRAIGMEGLFALTGVLCLARDRGGQVPGARAAGRAARRRPAAARCATACSTRELLRLNAGIFILHIVLYAMFVVVPPLRGARRPGAAGPLEALSAGGAGFVRPDGAGDPVRRPAQPPQAGAARAPSCCCSAPRRCSPRSDAGLASLAALMLAFFVAFNVLEALLPSLVSRLAPAEGRGVAIGVYNTTQTLGVFFGGLAGRLGGEVLRDYRGIRRLRRTGRTMVACWPWACGPCRRSTRFRARRCEDNNSREV